MHVYIKNWRVVHRQYLCNCLLSTHNLLVGWKQVSHWSTRRWIPSAKKFLGCVRNHMCLTWSWHVRCTHTSMTKITTPSENCSTWHKLSLIHILHLTVNVGSTNTFCRQKLDYCALSLFEGIHGRSLTVISLLLRSTAHCRYRVYTKFLLTYTAIYRGNRKVLPLGITALQPQSHFHLGTPNMFKIERSKAFFRRRL